VLADRGLLKGKTVGVDATTLEANAATWAIVHRDNGATYEEFLTGLAQQSGIETPSRENLARVDGNRSSAIAHDSKCGVVDPGHVAVDDLAKGRFIACLQAWQEIKIRGIMRLGRLARPDADGWPIVVNRNRHASLVRNTLRLPRLFPLAPCQVQGNIREPQEY
jgi:hypothetical protein